MKKTVVFMESNIKPLLTESQKCQKCFIKFPDGYVQPFFGGNGFIALCAVCALEERNKVHGLNEKKFYGRKANALLKKTRTYLTRSNVL